MTDPQRIRYQFDLPDGSTKTLDANEAQTVHRSVSMFLPARELVGEDGADRFAGLEELYENLHVMNRDMSRRLSAATRTDPARNAMAVLDSYTTLLPAALEDSLAELKPLFDTWQAARNQAI
jgi:hypothetical protein